MTQYVAKPHAEEIWEWVKGTDHLAKTVFEAEPAAPKKIGILDASGIPIYRVEERHPVGFIHWGTAQ